MPPQHIKEPLHIRLIADNILSPYTRHLGRVEEGQPRNATSDGTTMEAMLAVAQDVAVAERGMLAELEEELLPQPGRLCWLTAEH